MVQCCVTRMNVLGFVLVGLVTMRQTWAHGYDIGNDATERGSPNEITTMDIKMPGARPAYDDQYLCASVPVETGYVVGYKALADATKAHHILLFGCEKPAKYNGIWECGSTCAPGSQRSIMFAWAKNAPPLKLPDDVGYELGEKSGVSYIVIQIHYAHKLDANSPEDTSGIQLQLTKQRQKFKAGIFLLMANWQSIPANKPVVHIDVSCKFVGSSTIYPFGYRTHAHTLSRVITGYQYNTTWYELGKGNPQWPQAFYPMKNRFAIKSGDSLVARCTYNSTGVNHAVRMGSTAHDEMCNFYMMYYTDAIRGSTFGTCSGNRLPRLVEQIPEDSDKPLPPNPALDEMAKGHHHGSHAHEPGVKTHEDGGDQDFIPVDVSGEDAKGMPAMTVVSDWPENGNITIGQVGGLATDQEGCLYIFHRAKRIWDGGSFNVMNVFQHQEEPIPDNTLLKLDRKGNIIKQWGSNKFYMPHGLEVDHAGNMWLTDVAMHQVFRYPANSEKPDLTLGKLFVPGDDNSHFCKPADVAVLSTGEFFVADGYCNARIMKFSKDGKLLATWGTSSLGAPAQRDGFPPTNTFEVVHSVTVAEDKGLVCASDRENGRIQCYKLDGTFDKQIHNARFGNKLFAVEYCPQHGGVLFAINGQSPYNHLPNGQNVIAQGFTLNINTGDIIGTWQPGNTQTGFSFPHDLAVHSAHHEVYVGEIGPNVVWKFVSRTQNSGMISEEGESHETEKKSGIPSPEEGENVKSVTKKPPGGEEEPDPKASIIIGTLLIVPIIFMVVITILIRLHSKGKLQCCHSKPGRSQVFNLGNYFNSHKGFDPLSTEESDHEIDPLNDSDEENYSTTLKA